MTIRGKLEVLRDYYAKNRRVGHTQTMINGVDKNTIVIDDRGGLRDELKNKVKKIISLSSLSKAELDGLHSPMVIDNFAIYSLLEETLNLIKLLYERNEVLGRDLSNITRITNKYRENIPY